MAVNAAESNYLHGSIMPDIKATVKDQAARRCLIHNPRPCHQLLRKREVVIACCE
jgi:hypothetical protein